MFFLSLVNFVDDKMQHFVDTGRGHTRAKEAS